jgi:hypothetical protein
MCKRSDVAIIGTACGMMWPQINKWEDMTINVQVGMICVRGKMWP